MKTASNYSYSEFKGRKPFDWNKFLNKKTFSDEEAYKARWLAEDWVTCACGNQWSIIPRDSLGRPIDANLRLLGTKFSYRINDGNILGAKHILKKIEKRSAELIEEIKKSKNKIS